MPEPCSALAAGVGSVNIGYVLAGAAFRAPGQAVAAASGESRTVLPAEIGDDTEGDGRVAPAGHGCRLPGPGGMRCSPAPLRPR